MGSRVLVKLRYSDGTEKIGVFETQKELDWFIHNEGDHLVEVSYIDDDCSSNNS
jgi:hypothetical protein